MTGGPARPAASEAARTLLAAHRRGTLATLGPDGAPWASLVAYADDAGAPVLLVSRLAAHGRHLAADPRASLLVAASSPTADPLAGARVTLGGVLLAPADADRARRAFVAAVPGAEAYAGFADFRPLRLAVEGIRYVGGYGVVADVDPGDYSGARPDPVALGAGGALAHLNADHAEHLRLIAARLGGAPDASAARCTAIDRLGIELAVTRPGGSAVVRVAFARPLSDPAELRAASVELVRRAEATVH